jgi:TPR repeat protein
MCSKMNSKEVFDYLNSNKIENMDKFIKLCQQHINDDKNDSLAINNLGFIYGTVYKDHIKEEELYIKSAYLGNVKAMLNLAYLYRYTYKDLVKAEVWFLKAANLGNTVAMNNMGFIYEKNYKDLTKAKEWFLKAANLGDNYATHNLADIYYEHREYKKAFDLLIKIDKKYEHIDQVNKYLQICKQNLKSLDKIYGSIDTDECIICRDTLMKTNKSIIILVCGHMYHFNCIKSLKKCPCCLCTID